MGVCKTSSDIIPCGILGYSYLTYYYGALLRMIFDDKLSVQCSAFDLRRSMCRPSEIDVHVSTFEDRDQCEIKCMLLHLLKTLIL